MRTLYQHSRAAAGEREEGGENLEEAREGLGESSGGSSKWMKEMKGLRVKAGQQREAVLSAITAAFGMFWKQQEGLEQRLKARMLEPAGSLAR